MTYICSICGYLYEENLGDPDRGIAPGTRWDDLPRDWVCPLCRAAQSRGRSSQRVPGAIPRSGSPKLPGLPFVAVFFIAINQL